MQAGWDWAQDTHDVTVTDERGHRLAHWTLRHFEDDLVSTTASASAEFDVDASLAASLAAKCSVRSSPC